MVSPRWLQSKRIVGLFRIKGPLLSSRPLHVHAGRVAAHHRRNLEASAGVVVYSIDNKDEAAFVRLGMVVQRTLNRLARVGVQSMPVLSGLYLLDVRGSNPEIFSRRETRILHRS